MSTATSTAAAADQKPDILKWANQKGHFVRQVSSFRDTISSEPGARFAPEKGRYTLLVSTACPWAHRTLIVRKLKGLEDFIPVEVVDWFLDSNGWHFAENQTERPGTTAEKLYGYKYIREFYYKAEPNYSARFTVPVLWDTKEQTIVNNESSEIIRILNTAFNDQLPEKKRAIDLYPEQLRAEVDAVNEWVYDEINNGVYKAGFATSQEAYELNAHKVHNGLTKVEQILSKQDYLVGSQLTEADIRLFTTVVRFDPVYHGHFKCNLSSITHSFPNILRWLRRIYQTEGIGATVDMDHIKRHYYESHKQINPTGVVPLYNGPDLTLPIA
ncbi:extracellular matrix protein 4 [Ramicandelaber brevisporus]|nr:extracellular matrix protein 4 [Ramicandelaber brevisporus]